MARAFGIPGLYRASMKWSKVEQDGIVFELRQRPWKGNFNGWYVRCKSQGIEKQYVFCLEGLEAIRLFRERMGL